MSKAIAPTKRSAIKTIYASLQLLKANGGQIPRKDLIEQLTKELTFEPWENERYESNGQLKWLTIFLFYTVDCIKAGWLIKDKGTWYLTPAGEAALQMQPEQLLDVAGKAYRDWRSANPVPEKGTEPIGETEVLNISNEQVQQATLDEVHSQARNTIMAFIQAMDGYKFQKVCEALIKTMGFHVDFNSPRGKDGGVDIIAFKDALGFEKPKLKVQVKRYKEDSKIDVDQIRILRGLLNKGEDIGIYITTSSFTADAERFARQSDIHIKLINGITFIDLWQEHYAQMGNEEKALIPLQSIYFLGTLEYN